MSVHMLIDQYQKHSNFEKQKKLERLNICQSKAAVLWDVMKLIITYEEQDNE